MKKPSAKIGSDNEKEDASVLPQPPHSPMQFDLEHSKRQRPEKKRAKLPTENEQKLIREYGEIILRELAYGIRDKCRRPFRRDGSLTKWGLKAAREIVDNLFYSCGDERFFDEVTKNVLMTFPQFYDHDPEYGNDDVN